MIKFKTKMKKKIQTEMNNLLIKTTNNLIFKIFKIYFDTLK